MAWTFIFALLQVLGPAFNIGSDWAIFFLNKKERQSRRQHGCHRDDVEANAGGAAADDGDGEVFHNGLPKQYFETAQMSSDARQGRLVHDRLARNNCSCHSVADPSPSSVNTGGLESGLAPASEFTDGSHKSFSNIFISKLSRKSSSESSPADTVNRNFDSAGAVKSPEVPTVLHSS